MKKRVVIATLLATSIAGGAWLVGREGAAQAPTGTGPAPAPAVSVEEVAARQLAESVELTGILAAVEHVELRARVSGFVESVSFVEGGLVKKGQVLFRLDARPFQAALQRAEAELARARAHLALTERQLERGAALVAERAISESKHEDLLAARNEAAAQVDAARAAVTAAALELGHTRVVAPIAGRVGEALVRPGNLVSGGTDGATLLTTIVSNDPIHAELDVDEPTFLRLVAGRAEKGALAPTPVELRIGDTGDVRTGHLDFLGNQLDPSSGTARVRAVLPNEDGRLSPGLFVRAKLPVARPAPTAVVSDHAVATDQGGRYVLVVDEENVVRHRPVKLGGLAEGKRIVREGLEAGERIVVGGMVRPGTKVEPKQAEPTAVGAL